MKIKSVIIDTTLPSASSVNPALWQYNSQALIDWQIQKIQNSGRTAIVVIGTDGDEILQQGKNLDSCDLVFSTETIPFGGLLAGLHGTGVCAFYLPVEVPFPAENVWSELEKEYIKLPYNHSQQILKSETSDYPWLITKIGRDIILDTGKVIAPDLSQSTPTLDMVTATDSRTKTTS